MTDKLAITTPSALQPADAASADLAAILRAAQNPTTNIDTVERLLTMHRDLMKDQARTSYRAAMARLQGRLPQIAKSGTIDHGPGKMKNRFARLEDIDQAIRPICAEEGFAFSYDSKPGPTGITYSCEMSHKDGHAEVKTLTLPVDNSGAKNPVQAVGSSTSYARRNLLHRHVTTHDVANSVLFLLSEASSRTTGCVIPVDGGVAAAFPR